MNTNYQNFEIKQPPKDNESIFSADLVPHRSLGQREFQLLMLVLGAVSIVFGTYFFVLGAWPVTSLLVLNILIVWIAFRFNYRGAKVREYVQISDNEIYICGVSASGRKREFRYNPKWVRLSIEKIENEGVKNLIVTHGGKGCLVGSFLNPCDLESFATAFKAAVETARLGKRYS